VTSQQQQRASAVSSANNLQFSYVTKSSGTITVGYTYVILTNTSLNVTNVGAADNNVGTVFVATGTTPTAWGTGTLGEMDMVGNLVTISGAVEIQTISKKYFQYGNRVRLLFTGTPQVTHGTTTSGDDCGIELTGGTNITAVAGDFLELELRNDDIWYQVGGTSSFDAGVWTEITSFTATPPSTSTITVPDLTDIVKAGYGIKYKLTGIADARLGVITDINATTITVGGVPLSADIEYLYFCKSANVKPVPYSLHDGSYTVHTNILADANNSFLIELQDSYLVYFKVRALTVDTGGTKASLKPMNGANPVFGAGDGIEMTSDATWNDSGITCDPDYYKFSGFDNFRIDISEAGTNGNTIGGQFLAYFILEG